MKQVILQHGEMITIVGALVGIGAFGYGIFVLLVVKTERDWKEWRLFPS